MKIRKAALLLVAVLMVLAATAPAPAASASCEGACGANEVIISCPWTLSASQCCAYARWSCGTFSGVCAGDAEILC